MGAMSVDVRKIFGDNLRRMIAERHLQQNEFAASINVSSQYINGIVQAHTYVSKKNFEKLCIALNARPVDFFVEEGTPYALNKNEKELLDLYREINVQGQGPTAISLLQALIGAPRSNGNITALPKPARVETIEEKAQRIHDKYAPLPKAKKRLA